MEITNPAFDYDNEGHSYSDVRQADPRIGQYILDALEEESTVLNVGAGAGSYEPQNKYVIAVEPSSAMRGKRLELGRYPAVNAKADDLPFDDGAFDAAMAVLTIHHWPDLSKGLEEVKRVVRKRVAILTYDPTQLDIFWNVNYFPELIEIERRRYPDLELISDSMGQAPKLTTIQVPLDCSDGFQEAFYGRPEAFLEKNVRDAQSAWGFLDEGTEKEYVDDLRRDLESGEWDRQYGHHRSMPFFEGAFRLLEFDLGH